MASGLILGIIQAALVLTISLMGIDIIRPPLYYSLINITVVVIVIVYGTKRYRDELLGGVINYSKAFWFGVLICVFAGIIYGVYMVAHVNIIDKTYLTQFFSTIEEEYYKAGFNEKEISDAMKIIEWMQKPIGMVIFKIFELSFTGILISLFTSIFLKKRETTLKIQN
mgnify:CR=1 FL=1